MSDFTSAVDAFRRGDLAASRAAAEKQLELAPDANWHHLLGLIHCRLGEPGKGVEHLRAAYRADPDNAAFQVMLGSALIDSGRGGEVLEMPEPGGASPKEALTLWHVRAEAAQQSGDAAAAIVAWRAIAALREGDSKAWINVARQLLAEREFDEAEVAYRRALAISPADRDAIGELALVYDRTARTDAMAELLQKSHKAGVGKDEVPLAWATLEQRRGNLGEALALLSGPVPARDSMRWLRLRARLHDALGDTASAFADAVAMNRATPDYSTWRQRASAYRRQLRALAGTITPAWADKVPTLPPPSRQPVFLLGFPRSGTTLLDTFLMGHEDVSVIEERPLLFDAVAEVGGIENLSEARLETLSAARGRYLLGLDAEAGGGRAIIIDKFPLNMVAAPLIHALFPGAPILFAQRHPCDCVLSGFMQAFVANLGMASFLDLEDAADFYDTCMTVWTASYDAVPLNVHAVRYEALVAEPEATLRSTTKFLGLDWDDQVLDHQRTAAARGDVPNTSHDQIIKPLNSEAVQRWRRYESELAPVLPTLLPWAERLGYEN